MADNKLIVFFQHVEIASDDPVESASLMRQALEPVHAFFEQLAGGEAIASVNSLVPPNQSNQENKS